MSKAVDANVPVAMPAHNKQSIIENHTFQLHIAFFFALLSAALIGTLAALTWFQMEGLAGSQGMEAGGATRDTAFSLLGTHVFIFLLSLPATWWLAGMMSGRLDILKRQAAVIRELDFQTEVPLTTPIREIFGLGRALRQMKDTIQKFIRVSVALSGERDFEKLLGRVLHEMREAINGDGGVIYLYDDNSHVLQQASQRWPKGRAPVPNAWQDISLTDATHPVGQAVSRQDETTEYEITHPRPAGMEFLDERYGKNPVMMVAIPLRASDGSLVGIVCNFMAQGMRTPSSDRKALAEAFSSAAAVAIDQQRLLEAQKALMDSMIKIMAGAIDAKSPYTGGHCERVPELGIMLAEAASKAEQGPLANFAFKTEEEWREFRIGAWLHDCGKVTTPEYVVDKATKLETINNRIHEIRTRFEIILRDARIEALEAVAAGIAPNEAAAEFTRKRDQLIDDFSFVAQCNLGGEFMSAPHLERLRKIATTPWVRHFDDRLGLSEEELKRYRDEPVASLPTQETLLGDKPHHIIARTDTRVLDPKHGFKVDVPKHLYNHGELYNLSIGRGTLTEEERFKINEHVIHSLVMLEHLPLPKNLRRVPEYAGTHHENLKGTGYPRRLNADQLTVPMRIMAIADVFEALTACDRPYKKAKTLSESIKILAFMKKDGHIDPDLFDLFLSSGVYRQYAERYLLPEQIDTVDIEQYLH